VLVVKENRSQWSLPGGGVDHEEDIHDALKRELYEEALIETPFTETIVDTAVMFVESKEAWLMWLVYVVDIEDFSFGIGPDADEVAFMDPRQFKDSPHRSEQLVYEFATKHLR
jgi:ADP-ribose pyrophosphatase YjhB (NUDIX family)